MNEIYLIVKTQKIIHSCKNSEQLTIVWNWLNKTVCQQISEDNYWILNKAMHRHSGSWGVTE